MGDQDENARVPCKHYYAFDIFGECAWDVVVCWVGLGCGEVREVGKGEVEGEEGGVVEVKWLEVEGQEGYCEWRDETSAG